MYLDGKHSHDYAACDAIPFASAEGERATHSHAFRPTTTLLPINQVIDHAYITLLFPPSLQLNHARRNRRGKRLDIFSFSIRLMDIVVVFKFAIYFSLFVYIYIFNYSNVKASRCYEEKKEKKSSISIWSSSRNFARRKSSSSYSKEHPRNGDTARRGESIEK